jgi:hypothetical protein
MNETILYLLERITRAKMALERLDVAHRFDCASEDPHVPAPCTCGADKINAKVDATLRELTIVPDKIRMG